MRGSLIENVDSWTLPLEQGVVESARGDHAFILEVVCEKERCELRIEQPFKVRDSSGAVKWIDPSLDESPSLPTVQTGKLVVERAMAYKDGALELRLSSGVEVWVDPSPDYEAWTLAGPTGLKVVSLPGGELSIWR